MKKIFILSLLALVLFSCKKEQPLVHHDHINYKIYSALITQTGTNAPTVVILEPNTIGNIVWTYVGIGQYKGTLAGAFQAQKTAFLFAPGQGNKINTAISLVPPNSFNISVYVADVLADNYLYETLIEIRVYD